MVKLNELRSEFLQSPFAAIRVNCAKGPLFEFSGKCRPEEELRDPKSGESRYACF